MSEGNANLGLTWTLIWLVDLICPILCLVFSALILSGPIKISLLTKIANNVRWIAWEVFYSVTSNSLPVSNCISLCLYTIPSLYICPPSSFPHLPPSLPFLFFPFFPFPSFLFPCLSTLKNRSSEYWLWEGLWFNHKLHQMDSFTTIMKRKMIMTITIKTITTTMKVMMAKMSD